MIRLKRNKYDFVSFETEENGNIIIANIDLQTDTDKPIFPFTFRTNDPNKSQMMVERLETIIKEEKKKFAKDLMYWLDPEEVSEIKIMLNKDWDARNHCYK